MCFFLSQYAHQGVIIYYYNQGYGYVVLWTPIDIHSSVYIAVFESKYIYEIRRLGTQDSVWIEVYFLCNRREGTLSSVWIEVLWNIYEISVAILRKCFYTEYSFNCLSVHLSVHLPYGGGGLFLSPNWGLVIVNLSIWLSVPCQLYSI